MKSDSYTIVLYAQNSELRRAYDRSLTTKPNTAPIITENLLEVIKDGNDLRTKLKSNNSYNNNKKSSNNNHNGGNSNNSHGKGNNSGNSSSNNKKKASNSNNNKNSDKGGPSGTTAQKGSG